MTRRQKKESRVCFVLGEAMSRRSNLFTDTCVLKHRQMMTSDLSRVLCSTPSGILFSLLVFFSFFMKGRTKGIIKEQQAKGNLEHFFSFSSFFFFSFCKVHYILVVQSQRYKLYIIERLLLALDGRQM